MPLARLASILLALTFLFTAHAAEEDEDAEPVPEGYEQRHYPVRALMQSHGGISDREEHTRALNENDIAEIIRYACAPDSWSKRGAAKIQFVAGSLVVTQKKEVHAEIEKTLAWLYSAVFPNARVTVVAARLNAETIKKLSDPKGFSADDLWKALDAAGEAAGTQVADMRGVEGQHLVAEGGTTHGYIKDYDVSGAVFDPILAHIGSGLAVEAMPLRYPDCTTVQVELRVALLQKPAFSTAGMTLDGVTGETMRTDSTGDDDKKVEIKTVLARTIKPFHGNLKIDLPLQVKSDLTTTVNAPAGKFKLASVMDDSLASGKPGARVAIFVRASVGAEGIPTLLGVSGLKEGESFRLIPVEAATRAVPDFQPKFRNPLGRLEHEVVAQGAVQPGVNAFEAPPLKSAPTLSEMIMSQQRAFAEKVRKNKIVESRGSLIFARLNNDDHKRLIDNLLASTQTPHGMKLHAISLAMPAAAYQKLATGNTETLEDAAVEALLSGAENQVLFNAVQGTLQNELTQSFVGHVRNYLADYDISGDSYDPVIHAILERGYTLSVTAGMRGDKLASLEISATTMPGEANPERSVIDSFTVQSSQSGNSIIGAHLDLDKPRLPKVALSAGISLPPGKFVLAGACKMPPLPDGKPDNRQAVLLVKVDAD